MATDPAPAPRPADLRRLRRARVARRAAERSGVISRRELYALGLSRAEVRATSSHDVRPPGADHQPA